MLNDFPLVGSQAKKFHLGELAGHRGKTVDDVIRTSVLATLERSNYNNPGEVRNLLRSIGVDDTLVEPRFNTLAATMERRHWIVHRTRTLRGARGTTE